MKKKIGIIAILALMSTFVFGNESYNLETAKNKVVNDNINVAIAYQNYVTVKGQAQVKTLQLLPNINVDMLIYNYQYTILRSIIPEPSRFFDAASAKDLAEAANVNRTIVKKNLLEDLEKTYFLLQFHKEVLSSFVKELEIKTLIAEKMKEAYELGSVSFEEFYNSQREVILGRSNIVNANELVNAEEFALKLILQVENNLDALSLEKQSFYNEKLNYPIDLNQAMNLAADNSKEVEQFDNLISAAQNTKKSVVLSFITWNGVGFDYFSKISVARSEIEKIKLQREKTIFEIKNQIAAIYSEIEKHKEKIEYQNDLLSMVQNQYNISLANYNNQLTTLVTLKKSELDLLVAQRDVLRLKYELELKYIHLKRLLGTNMLNNEIPKA